MKLLSPTISRLFKMRYWHIEQWMQNPIAAQRNVLQHIVTHAQYTEIGRKFGLTKLFSIRDFKNTIPLHEYTDTAPYIQRMMQGEENILWNTPIDWFAKSSGTTNAKSKFIPISEESLYDCHYEAAKDALSLYFNFNTESNLIGGKGLVLGGSHQINEQENSIRYGDLSAVLLQNAPFWGQWIRTPELSIALLDEWETKIEQLAVSTIKENVTSIAGVPTWTLVLLKRILEITQKQNIKEVWPNLELYIHGGVSFTPYKQQFEALMGSPIYYQEIYNASEGFFAAQDNLQEEGMLLLLDHGIFYEFMPLEEYGKANAKTIGLDKVQKGVNYVIVITTNGGLWRYIVGDTIAFTSLNPFRIKVIGRVKHFINAFGEELMVDNADKALAHACEVTQSSIIDYTAAPIYFGENNNGAHEWCIAFEQEPKSIEAFAYELDEALKTTNSDYEAKRYKNIALSMPTIHAVSKNVFHEWLAKKGKLGGQHKVPRLSNNREVIEEIKELAFIKKTD